MVAGQSSFNVLLFISQIEISFQLFPALEPGFQINWDDFIDKIFSVEIISVIAADKMSEHFTIFVSLMAFPSSKTLWIVKFPVLF